MKPSYLHSAVLVFFLLAMSTVACSSDDGDYPFAEAQQEWFQYVNTAVGWTCDCGLEDPSDQVHCRNSYTFSDHEKEAIQQCMTDLFQEFRTIHETQGNRGNYEFSDPINFDYYYCIVADAYDLPESDFETTYSCLQSADDVDSLNPADDPELFTDIDNLPDTLQDYLDCNTDVVKRQSECFTEVLDEASISAQCSTEVGEALDECEEEAGIAIDTCDRRFEDSGEEEAIRAFLSWAPYVGQCGGYLPSPGGFDDDPPNTNQPEDPEDPVEQCIPDNWDHESDLVDDPMRTIASAYTSQIEDQMEFREQAGCTCFAEEWGFESPQDCMSSLFYPGSQDWAQLNACAQCEFFGEDPNDNPYPSNVSALEHYCYESPKGFFEQCVDFAVAEHGTGECSSALRTELQQCIERRDEQADQCFDDIGLREFRDEQFSRLESACPTATVSDWSDPGDTDLGDTDPVDPDPDEPNAPDQPFEQLCQPHNSPECVSEYFVDGLATALIAYYQYLHDIKVACGGPEQMPFADDPDQYQQFVNSARDQVLSCVNDLSPEPLEMPPFEWFQCRHSAYQEYFSCMDQNEYPPVHEDGTCDERTSSWVPCLNDLMGGLSSCSELSPGDEQRLPMWYDMHEECDMLMFGGDEEFRESEYFHEEW